MKTNKGEKWLCRHDVSIQKWYTDFLCSSDIIFWLELDAAEWTLSPNASIINDKQDISHMVNKTGTVKTLKLCDKVIMGLKLNGELGRTNVTDKWLNGLCMWYKNIYCMVTPCPTTMDNSNQTSNILFGNWLHSDESQMWRKVWLEDTLQQKWKWMKDRSTPGVCLNCCDPGLHSSSDHQTFFPLSSLLSFHGNGVENNWLSLAATVPI